MLDQFSEWLKLLLQVANVVIIGYGLYKFLHRPQDTIQEEIKKIQAKQVAHDLLIKEMQKELDASFEKHREQERTNAVFKKVFLLLANFEVAFCLHSGYEHTEDLTKAKEELDNYLAGN